MSGIRPSSIPSGWEQVGDTFIPEMMALEETRRTSARNSSMSVTVTVHVSLCHSLLITVGHCSPSEMCYNWSSEPYIHLLQLGETTGRPVGGRDVHIMIESRSGFDGYVFFDCGKFFKVSNLFYSCGTNNFVFMTFQFHGLPCCPHPSINVTRMDKCRLNWKLSLLVPCVEEKQGTCYNFEPQGV